MKTLFLNGQIWDGESDQAVPGHVLIDGQRIEAVARQPETLPRDGAIVIDAAGATLMPALVDAHGHLPFPDNTTYLTQLEDTPVEDSKM